MTEPAESELAALRRQDAAAFTRLVGRCQGIVMGIGQTLGIHGANLDDAAAEAFAEVFKSLPRFEARAELTTWVYRVAYRAMVRTRKKLRPLGVGGGVGGGAAEILAGAESGAEKIGGGAERNEEYAVLWAAVEKLEPQQAIAVELFYRRGMSVEEMAGVLECPVGTVKTHLYRAREALRRVLGGSGLKENT